jgi:hypothetical protein
LVQEKYHGEKACDKRNNNAILLQAWTGPEGSRRLSHMKVVKLSALLTGRLHPQEISWYSFLLKAEPTPGPQCGRKDYVHEKFQ